MNFAQIWPPLRHAVHRIDHAERPMAEWVDVWEQLFNLGDGEDTQNGDSRLVNH
jgi:hypothetical protein